MSEIIATVIGYVVLVLLSGGVLAGGIALIYHVRRNYLVTLLADNETAVRRQLGTQFLTDSHRFGENPSTQRAIRLYGESLSKWGSADVERIRTDWREAAAKEE